LLIFHDAACGASTLATPVPLSFSHILLFPEKEAKSVVLLRKSLSDTHFPEENSMDVRPELAPLEN
jgi:hypothetical protein